MLGCPCDKGVKCPSQNLECGMWMYLLQGIGFGLAAASQPGPFQAYLIAQSIGRGWRQTLPFALAPLCSDGPIIAFCLLVLSQVPTWMEQVLNGLSGLFILYLAWGTFRVFRKPQTSDGPEPGSERPMAQAVMMNMLSPGPYIFWTLVTGPILVSGWRQGPADGFAFLGGFYLTLVSGLAAIIVVFGLAARYGERVKHGMLGLSALALAVFGFYQLSRAFNGVTAL